MTVREGAGKKVGKGGWIRLGGSRAGLVLESKDDCKGEMEGKGDKSDTSTEKKTRKRTTKEESRRDPLH